MSVISSKLRATLQKLSSYFSKDVTSTVDSNINEKNIESETHVSDQMSSLWLISYGGGLVSLKEGKKLYHKQHPNSS